MTNNNSSGHRLLAPLHIMDREAPQGPDAQKELEPGQQSLFKRSYCGHLSGASKVGSGSGIHQSAEVAVRINRVWEGAEPISPEGRGTGTEKLQGSQQQDVQLAEPAQVATLPREWGQHHVPKS